MKFLNICLLVALVVAVRANDDEDYENFKELLFPTTVTDKCPMEGFFSHPTDTRKFVRCELNLDIMSYDKCELSCKDQKVWVQELQACGPKNYSHKNDSDSQINIDTPADGELCSAEGFFPNKDDCSKFYRCVWNGYSFLKFDFQCPEGLGWDELAKTCNYRYLIPRCNTFLFLSNTFCSKNKLNVV